MSRSTSSHSARETGRTNHASLRGSFAALVPDLMCDRQHDRLLNPFQQHEALSAGTRNAAEGERRARVCTRPRAGSFLRALAREQAHESLAAEHEALYAHVSTLR